MIHQHSIVCSINELSTTEMNPKPRAMHPFRSPRRFSSVHFLRSLFTPSIAISGPYMSYPHHATWQHLVNMSSTSELPDLRIPLPFIGKEGRALSLWYPRNKAPLSSWISSSLSLTLSIGITKTYQASSILHCTLYDDSDQ